MARAYATPVEIGGRIREYRIERGVRKELLAVAAGCSVRTLDAIERGLSSAQTHERLRAIADVLGVRFSVLTERTGNTLPQNIASRRIGRAGR